MNLGEILHEIHDEADSKKPDLERIKALARQGSRNYARIKDKLGTVRVLANLLHQSFRVQQPLAGRTRRPQRTQRETTTNK